jgi:hypothetical protein
LITREAIGWGFAHKKFTRRGEPVFGKRGLKIGYGFSFDANHGVAPTRTARDAFVPLVGDARAADERAFSIDNQKFAVGTIADAQDAIPTEAVVAAHPAARIEKRTEECVPRTYASERIDGQIDLHTGARAFRECLDVHAPDLAFVEYVRLKANTALRAADGLERSRVEIRAVGEDVQVSRAVGLGVGKRLKDVEEVPGVIGRHFLSAVDAVLGRGSEKPAEQIRSQHQGCSEAEHKNAGRHDDSQISEHQRQPSRSGFRRTHRGMHPVLDAHNGPRSRPKVGAK